MPYQPLPDFRLPAHRGVSALDTLARPMLTAATTRSATAARRESIRNAALAAMRDGLADRELTLKRVAVAVGVSERELQLILVEKGVAFEAKLREMRMERAAKLIVPGRPIAEVASLVGYAHANHLRPPFMKRYGVSPSVLCRARTAHGRYESRRVASLPESRRSLLALDRAMKSDENLVALVQAQLLAHVQTAA
jgi:AraC-like DNA-binding protein